MSTDEEHVCEACDARDELEDIAEDLMAEGLEKVQYAARLRTLAEVLSDEQVVDLAKQLREQGSDCIVLNTVGGDA